MWGDDSGGGVNVTRSNKAVNAFEPIQHLNPKSAVLYRLSGDGRLGPLDLLVDQIPDTGTIQPPGLFYAPGAAPSCRHASASSRSRIKKVVDRTHAHVNVTDAGDPVAGAVVTVHGVAQDDGRDRGASSSSSAPRSRGSSRSGSRAPGYWRLTKTVAF